MLRGLYSSEALHPPASALKRLKEAEPYSLQWFENIETLRHGRQGRWIPRLLEFTKHPGETLLCLGHGLGTDWLQYARHGASVVVCSPAQSQLGLVKRNFELRGLTGRFVHASPSALPMETASIDVACLVGLLEIAPEPAAVIDEVYRVLKPGGKVFAVTPACFDVEFWQRCVFFWNRWLNDRGMARDDALRFSGLACGGCSVASWSTARINGIYAERRCRTFGAGCRCRCWSGCSGGCWC